MDPAILPAPPVNASAEPLLPRGPPVAIGLRLAEADGPTVPIAVAKPIVVR